jgi:O-antigen/teichoic acid export membrane protein
MRSYVMGLSSGFAVAILTIIIGLWLTPFALHFLGREEYAVFLLANDLLMWLGLIDLGMTGSLQGKAAQYVGRKETAKLKELVSTTFFAQCAMGLVLCLLGSLFAILFPQFFGIRPELKQSATWTLLILVIGSAIAMAGQTFSSLLLAYKQIHVDNTIRLALIILRTVLTVIFLLLGWRVLSLAAANIIATILTTILAVYRCRLVAPEVNFSIRSFSFPVLKSVYKLGFWFALGGVAGIFIENLDRVMAAKLISVEAVTTLSITARLYLLAYTLIKRFTDTARPHLGQLFGRDDYVGARKVYDQIFTYSLSVTFIASGIVWLCNESFVRAWVGPQFYGGKFLDTALALNLLFNCWVLPNRATLAASLRYVANNSTCRCIEGIFNFGLAILFARIWGLAGIAFSTAVASLVISGWYLPFLTSKLFDCSFLQTLSKPLSAMSVAFSVVAAIFIAHLFKWPAGLGGALMMSVWVLLMTLPALWFVVLGEATRRRFLAIPNRFKAPRVS